MFKYHDNVPRFLSTDKSASELPCTSTGPILKLKRDRIIDMQSHFCLVLKFVYCASEMEGWTPG